MPTRLPQLRFVIVCITAALLGVAACGNPRGLPEPDGGCSACPIPDGLYVDGGQHVPGADGGNPGPQAPDAGPTDPSDAGHDAGSVSPSWDGGLVALRVVAANLTSGNRQSYDGGEGSRIPEALRPDVVLLQEFNVGSNSDADLRAFADAHFGPDFHYTREAAGQIPNAVISRYPILAGGEWDDPEVDNRDFVWAQIDLPGPRDLWAVSLHLLTSSGTDRQREASALVSALNTAVPQDALLVVGGDLNTTSRTEACISTLGQWVGVAAPHPADGNGLVGTNASRDKPYDWVLASPSLKAFQVPVRIGASSFTHGPVFDSRVYTPLSEVPPVLKNDSGAVNMQHMAVTKDFLVAP